MREKGHLAHRRGQHRGVGERRNLVTEISTRNDGTRRPAHRITMRGTNANQGDTDLELRLKAIETELALQKQTNIENHNRVSTLLAVVGVGLTIITILINVWFNMIH